MPLNIDDDAVRNIPEQPGVYLFKLGDKALYIGKASNLKKRVSQYFRGRDHITIGNLLKQSDGIEYIVTKNEKDALLLEYNLIHNYRPPFNIRLKDDKSFPFIEITKKDAFPGVYYSRHATPGNFRVGPITNSAKTRSLIDTITRVFKLRTCTTTAFNRGIPCLYYHIDRCSAPCAGKIKAEHYMADVKDAVDFLKGKRGKILENLKGKMTAAAEALEFEKAQEIKEDLQLLENFNPDSYISSVRKADYDVIALHYTNGYCFVVRFSVVEGRVKSKDFFDFDTFSGEREDVLRDFLISVYSGESIPPEIMVDVMPTDEESLMQLFSQLAGRKVRLKIPVKGDKRKLALLAAENLNYFIARTDYSAIGGRLKEALHLERFPFRIEGYDISHFSERERVGAVVVFSRGVADRKRYRNYIIKNASPGDTEALKEVLERRLAKMQEYPDLLLIDGGKGQLSAALEVKAKLGVPCDIVAIAKEEERIFMETGDSLVFPADSPESFLLQNIRNEVHRRAVTHHRKRRQKLPKA